MHACKFAEGSSRECDVIVQDCSGAGVSWCFQNTKTYVVLVTKKKEETEAG